MTIESLVSKLRQVWAKCPSALRFLNVRILSSAVAFGAIGIFITLIIVQGSATASPGHDGGHEGESEAIGSISNFPMVTVEQPRSADKVELNIEAAGQAFAQQQADLFPSQDGVVQSLSVNLGSRVRQGQVLATLRPDLSQQQLAAEITFKKKELEIARERSLLTIDSHLRTTEEERDAELNRIETEIAGLGEMRKQALQSMRNASFDLLESVNEMLFSDSRGIANYLNNSAYDYYRRPEAFPGFGNDYAVREKFEYRLLALKNTLLEEQSEPSEIATIAMGIGQDARQIALRIAETPAFPASEVDRIRKEIGEVTDHLSESMEELASRTSELASLQAEKRKILATTERELADVRGGKKNADLDAEIIAADILRLQQQMVAGRSIIAPFSGVITKRHVNLGESVTLEKPLFSIIDDSKKYIRFSISESDLPFVRLNTLVEFSPTSAPSETFTAVVKRIAQSIDPVSRTIQVEADVPPQENADRILAQITIRVRIPVTQDPALMVIPEAALQISKESGIAWLVMPDVTVEPRKVDVAFVHSGYAYIQSGITLNDWVVVRSPVELSTGLAVDTKQLPPGL